MLSTKKDVLTPNHNSLEGENKKIDTISFKIDLPRSYSDFLDFLEVNFGLNRKSFIEKIIKTEIKNRIWDIIDFKKMINSKDKLFAPQQL